MSALAGGPQIPLPASLGRALRLGPFPSGWAAAKFAAYVALALVVAWLVSPIVGLPFVGVGLLLTAYAPGGEPLDVRVARFVKWRRRRLAPPGVGPRRPRRADRAARLPDGRCVVALTVGGVPVAFLPPGAAHRLFEGYRNVLQGLDEPVFLRVATEPISDRSFRLPAPIGEGTPAETAARAGYDELVRLLCRRRHRRVVDVFLVAPGNAPDALTGLERRLHGLTEALRGIGLEPQRRVGRSLVRTLQRAGWTGGGS